MSEAPKPPKTYNRFVKRYPKLAEAWENMRAEEEAGPFDERTTRLLKLAIAVGSQKEGPVHSGVRKALAAGVEREEIEQIIALAASTIGLPPTVSVFSWILDELEGRERRP